MWIMHKYPAVPLPAILLALAERLFILTADVVTKSCTLTDLSQPSEIPHFFLRPHLDHLAGIALAVPIAESEVSRDVPLIRRG